MDKCDGSFFDIHVFIICFINICLYIIIFNSKTYTLPFLLSADTYTQRTKIRGKNKKINNIIFNKNLFNSVDYLSM